MLGAIAVVGVVDASFDFFGRSRALHSAIKVNNRNLLALFLETRRALIKNSMRMARKLSGFSHRNPKSGTRAWRSATPEQLAFGVYYESSDDYQRQNLGSNDKAA